MIYRRRICSTRTSRWSSFWRGWWRPPASPPKRGPLSCPRRSCGARGSCLRCLRRMGCTPWTTRSLEKPWKWRRRAAARALWMRREGWRASDCSSPAAQQWGGESDINTPKNCECTLSLTSWDPAKGFNIIISYNCIGIKHIDNVRLLVYIYIYIYIYIYMPKVLGHPLLVNRFDF